MIPILHCFLATILPIYLNQIMAVTWICTTQLVSGKGMDQKTFWDVKGTPILLYTKAKLLRPALSGLHIHFKPFSSNYKILKIPTYPTNLTNNLQITYKKNIRYKPFKAVGGTSFCISFQCIIQDAVMVSCTITRCLDVHTLGLFIYPSWLAIYSYITYSFHTIFSINIITIHNIFTSLMLKPAFFKA